LVYLVQDKEKWWALMNKVIEFHKDGQYFHDQNDHWLLKDGSVPQE
jgi:hypothetical protein